MKTPGYPKLTIRNGFAVTAEPEPGEQPAPKAGKLMPRIRCDRSGRIHLLREAYAALLRKERTPVA